eukprot:TRINITY_DN43909_c0_g1_i1.p1 TRINITY_DN43909_c0_g1~~TRINITY_DN43909_c0_g1_i1.p1  ORF type:complete len:236 (+),score=30.48 TRINITY_DN43909_c0_g1_i1:90-710(+)
MSAAIPHRLRCAASVLAVSPIQVNMRFRPGNFAVRSVTSVARRVSRNISLVASFHRDFSCFQVEHGVVARRQFSTAIKDSNGGGGCGEGASDGGEDTEQSLFSEVWWPKVAQHVHERLAGRPQLLPEDPMAHGVMSWIEYELACKPLSKQGAVDASNKDDVATPEAEPQTRRLDDELLPLPKDADWRWMLRSNGEIVGPKGGDSRG